MDWFRLDVKLTRANLKTAVRIRSSPSIEARMKESVLIKSKPNYYAIEYRKGTVLLQRKVVECGTDPAISTEEEVILYLCKKIEELECKTGDKK